MVSLQYIKYKYLDWNCCFKYYN